jgi:NTP pyrophosphatase (non-canonical NTP hydrolase)
MTLDPEYLKLIARLRASYEEHGVTVATQLLKVQEETGEVAAAYIGWRGLNPRKGVTHTSFDVAMELADVVISAVLAIDMLGHDPEKIMTAQMIKTEDRLEEYESR